MSRKTRACPLEYTGDATLDHHLDVLRPFFSRQGLQEIVAVKEGEVRMELEGGRWETVKAPDLTLERWRQLALVLATRQRQTFGDHQPRVSARLPGNHRFEAMFGRSVGCGLSVAIRVKRRTKFDYADWRMPADLRERLVEAVQGGHNIIVSGGTSSGKTQLLNRMIQDIPAEERILYAEDTPELDVPHANSVPFLLSRNENEPVVTYGTVFDHAMRARPDRLLLGEVSIPNAFPSLLFLNNGHKGFLCSIHANNCTAALETAFWFRLSQAGHHMDQRALFQFLCENIDLVVQVHRTGKGRREAVEWWEPSSGRAPQQVEGHTCLT